MRENYSAGAPLPPSVGLCADLYAEIRELRLAMQKEVDAVQKRESEIREHIINTLSKSADTGAAGKKYRAQIVTKETPRAADWDKVYNFVVATNRFDLLQKRLSDKAIKDMWDEGEEVPGVEKFKVVEVSITKI